MRKYRTKVFSVDHTAMQALEDLEVDIALVDYRNGQTGEYRCVVITYNKTARRHAVALNRLFNLQKVGFSHSTSLFRFVVRGKTSVEVICMLETILEIEQISGLS